MNLFNTKILALMSLIIFSTVNSYSKVALPKGVTYQIEPLYGFETVYRSTPTPHMLTRTMYGARLTAGIDIISLEVEYTKGSDTEVFTTTPESIKVDDEKLKLGARSTYRFNEYLFASARLGGQATKSTREETNSGIKTTTENPIKYDPYAGAFLGVRLGSLATLNVGSTVIFVDINDMSKNEYQNTLSVGLGF